MANGKLLILSAILKMDKPFRPPHIIDVTGLSRQLVHHHLLSLCESGGLEKIDKTYVIRDKEVLLNELIDSSDSEGVKRPEPGGFLTEITHFLTQMDIIIAGRTLDLPGSLDARKGMLEKIDESTKVLKQMRRYLTNSTRTVGSAQKYLKKQGVHDPETVNGWWQIFAHYGKDMVDIHEFEAALKEAMIDDED